MNLSVSNIAWKKHNTQNALSVLKKYNINSIDIAPTLLNENIENIKVQELLAFYNEKKIKLTGMQSLLFTCPAVSLFDGDSKKNIIVHHLKKVFKIANDLKIKNLVFGSPKNRFISNLNNFVYKNAVNIFFEIADIAKNFNCVICFEPNPKEYNCNFITNTFDAINFIKTVNHKNFKLNLDISTVILNNECLEKVFEVGTDIIEHIHISSPYLKDILLLDNKKIAKTIKQNGYKNNVALECNFQNIEDENLVELKKNVEVFSKEYSI
jgi:sugar phosphate isomerase/epimerase